MKSTNFFSLLFTLILVISLSDNSAAQSVTVNARVFLQGALMDSYATGETHGRQLMRDDLRSNPYNNQRVIPDQDIYQTPYIVNAYTKVDVTDKFTHVACGTYAQFQTIVNPNSIFAVQGENAIVDWIFVELRDKNDFTSVVATRSGLLQRDGDIIDIDGTEGLHFPNVMPDAYFLVIRHRNHLGIMTKYPLLSEDLEGLVDFTDPSTQVFDFGNTNNMFNYSGLAQKDMNINGGSYKALWAGDFDADGAVCYNAGTSDLNTLQKEVAGFDLGLNPMYKVSFNSSVGYLQGDFDMNGKAKFNSPEDDRNLILEQVLTYSQNSEVRANFVHLVEQLPK